MVLRIFVLFFVFPYSYAQVTVSDPIYFLALGDSYTIGASVSQTESWPYQLKESLQRAGFQVDSIDIIAQTGWTTRNLSNAISSAELQANYNLVSLLIGVNDQYGGYPISDYPLNFENLLKKAIELSGGDINKVIVLSIPDYGYTPFGKSNQSQISRQIDEYNQINKRISQQYNVFYVDITPISREGLSDPDLVANDGLHPSGKMYSLWVEMIMNGVIRGYTSNEPSIVEQVQPKVYPTLVKDKIIIENVGEEAFLLIYNINGTIIVQEKLKGNLQEIDLEYLEEGIYFYSIIKTEGAQSTGKFFK